MRFLLCCMAFLAAAVSAADRPWPDSTDQQISRLERRLKYAPKDNQSRNELAGAFLQKLRETADAAYLDRAARLVDQILASDPVHQGARRRRIELEMQRHRFRQAAELAEALSQEFPSDSTAWGLLGDALMELGEYERVADVYQTMVDLRPGLASYSRVAFYRFVTGDAPGGIEAMRMAASVGGPAEHVAWCLADLGNMLFKTGALDEAEAEFRRALDLVPGYHHALAGLGRVLAARGRDADAIRVLLQAQAKAPFPEYAGELAKLYRKTGRDDLARKQLALLDVIDKLGRAAGENANRSLALALSDLEHRTERSLELARAELEVRRDVYTYDALAWALFRNGKISEAAEAIRKALVWNTPEPSFREHATRILGTAALR